MATRAAYRRFVLTILLVPSISAALGIDGSAIFQIIAIENLGLSAEILGVAFGLCVLSVPFQLWAARMPLWRARRNIHIFLGLSAVQCVALAAIVAFTEYGDDLALAALAITVLAEINLSVLWATSWHPVVSYGLDVEQRQRINTRWGASARLLLAVVAVLVGAASEAPRVVYLLATAAVSLMLIGVTRDVAVPPPEPRRTSTARLPDEIKRIYVAVGLMAASAWPMFVAYAEEVMWPTVNLGVLAALKLVGTLFAAFTWRPTEGDVSVRGRRAAAGAIAASVGLAIVPGPVDGAVDAVFVVVFVAAAAHFGTTVFMTLMELAHRSIDADNSVKAMTFYDVVASTSMQGSLLVGGLLVGVSAGWTGWGTDPYRAYLVLSAVGVWVALSRATSERPQPGPLPAAR